ncbi:hypothetical protein BT67DRAFT_440409 [Trichocladium antarcticum]|uniref:Uncharacterized protein n=1 Tax=Trichocladium antarcticum TaxID=1450529 RepID=A0AAN6UP23_9PEZI|nr:hypothetical protein BT67DRAFT_440409 [Trichocladium antarcticum]
MLLKRKRSECELSYGSIFSSTQQLNNDCFNFDAMAAAETARRGFFSQRHSTPSHLHSRTMKRSRDNRPAESDVYQHTLDLLYSAQHRPHQPDDTQSPTTASIIAPSRGHAQTHHAVGRQRSLHSFWNLPRSTASSSTSTLSPASSAASFPSPSLAPQSISTHCEDCGVGLGGSEDDVMMDVDGYSLSREDQICGACGKTVCFSCSISNLGEHRRCLACAVPRG